MTIVRTRRSLLLLLSLSVSSIALTAEQDRRIEEVVVTAEQRESTVSDTALSITAFDQSMIEDLGIQDGDELVNFTPSTTRDRFDIRIRGIGRNFRVLGGDPGVATYYNSVYSEDFNIAATEQGLYDVSRIEVLRGPQGTLYGRNAIGGALNYITNRPNFDEVEAEGRFVAGNLGTQEYYGILSGPLNDRLAYRLVGTRRDRDAAQNGLDGSDDVLAGTGTDMALSLEWRMNDTMNFFVRLNERDGDQDAGAPVLVSEGPITNDPVSIRGTRNPDQYTSGMVATPAGWTGSTLSFTDPENGSPTSAIYARPGFDPASIRPSPAYGTNPDVFQPDIEDLSGDALTNNRNESTFNYQGVQTEWSWDINEDVQLRWIGGWSDYDFTFFRDLDRSTSQLTQYHETVDQSLESWSQELQLFWDIGDNISITSGLFYFDQDVRQRYAVADDSAQGRFTNAADYGALGPFISFFGEQKNLGDADYGQGLLGLWDGQENGRTYAFDNRLKTQAFAVYSQGTYRFSDRWALTLGLRYAKDEKNAKEQRFAYIEDNVNSESGILNGLGFQALWDGVCSSFVGAAVTCDQIGLTNLGVVNTMMGNAVPTGNPNAPLSPTCELDDPDCANPLRLAGVPLSFTEASRGKDEWSDTNFRVNLEWTPGDNTLIYGGVTTGYRAGGYSLGLLGTQTAELDENGVPIPLTTAEPKTYDKETVTAFELGYKSTMFDDRLQLFSSAYFYSYSDYQDEVEQYNPDTEVAENLVNNAGDTENWGLEIQASWIPTSNWMIGGNYSYTQTEYLDDVLIQEQDNPAIPTSLFDGTVINLKGNDLKRIPEHKATVYSFYDIRFPHGTVTLGGSVAYTGQFHDNSANRNLNRVRSRYRSDVSATWRDNANRWVVRGFIDNVTDEGAAGGIGTTDEAQNWQQTAAYLYPRYYGVDITYRFGHLL